MDYDNSFGRLRKENKYACKAEIRVLTPGSSSSDFDAVPAKKDWEKKNGGGERKSMRDAKRRQEKEEEENVMAENMRLFHRLSGGYRYQSPPLIYTVLTSNEIIKHNENLKVCFFLGRCQ